MDRTKPVGPDEFLLRIQLRRVKGWRMPPNTVKVSRPTIFGNPFVEHKGEVYAAPSSVHFVVRAAKNAADAYRLWLKGELLSAETTEYYRTRRQAILEELPRLKGKNLACWCKLCPAHKDGKPLGVECPDCAPCHADQLLMIVEEL